MVGASEGDEVTRARAELIVSNVISVTEAEAKALVSMLAERLGEGAMNKAQENEAVTALRGFLPSNKRLYTRFGSTLNPFASGPSFLLNIDPEDEREVRTCELRGIIRTDFVDTYFPGAFRRVGRGLNTALGAYASRDLADNCATTPAIRRILASLNKGGYRFALIAKDQSVVAENRIVRAYEQPVLVLPVYSPVSLEEVTRWEQGERRYRKTETFIPGHRRRLANKRETSTLPVRAESQA